MGESREWLIVVRLSDSFRSAVAELADELGLGVVQASGSDLGVVPPGGIAVLLLAGGEEAAAIELLEQSTGPAPPRFLLGAAPDHRLAAMAVARGAADYFALPQDFDLLRRTLDRAARAARAASESERFAASERERTGFDAILGRSTALSRVIAHARRIAGHRDLTVLLGGETGTGKELLARAVHYHSPRSRQPFIEINCAAIPANLLESELFGHERGAFTGAVQTKPGLFELADGGTVFLDEIGQLPLELQPKLLRVLESRELRRVGGNQIRRVDIRVVAATHLDLAAAVRTGGFREDLYFRLNVVSLILPPLREREGDVELLAEALLARFAVSYGLPVPALSADVRAALRRHLWPGNVRELRNALERGLVLSPPGTLLVDDLLPPASPPEQNLSVIPFPAPLAHVVRSAVFEMLRQTGGNKSLAARRLGISRPRLQRILSGESEDSLDAMET
ncbi:MAG TPA: sigma 54-interacting transcriptional regulator [Gemmatimonadales bacterium]|nr:sigma 54-interacting transcriptional regulator [Gemmatimonadales bacterium]